MVNIRFNYHEHGGGAEVFYQPLFFIGENLVQYCRKERGMKVDEEMVNKKLDFSFYPINEQENVKLEIPPINRKNDEIIISYTLQKDDINMTFTYSGATFRIQHLDLQTQKPIKVDHEHKHVLFSSYEISFSSEDEDTFQDFIKTSMKYYQKFYLGFKQEADKIKIFISSCEGSYFDSFGMRPKRSMDTIYLPKKQKEDIIKDINAFLDPKTKELYLELGIPYKRTYLFEGEMGAGKTSLITALASTIGYNLAIVSFTPKMTEVQLMKMLRNFNNEQGKDDNVIIVFEDMDCIFKERKTHDEARNSMSFSGILNALDGIATGQNRIVIITTQFMKNLDSALIRPGRVDYIMHFDYIIKEQIEDIFKAFTKCSNPEKIHEFTKLYFELNIKTSTSALQQYLLKYLMDADAAIDNIDELKKLFDMANIGPKKTEETGLYN
jgi:hypothetical protein